MTGRYAKDTTVSVERTFEEIRSTLKRYGAIKLAMFEDESRVAIAFEMRKRQVKFILPLPKRADYKYTTGGRHGSAGTLNPNAYDQALRQRWRALLLCIKAKLESVEAGIEDFDQAFMSQIVLPSGKTMGEWAVPQIEVAYETHTMPPLLSSGS